MTLNWKKTAIVVLDILVAGYLILAVTMFNNPDERATVCSEVNIDVESGPTHGFLNSSEVKRLLEQHHLYPLAQPMQFVNTRKIEETLCESPYVDNAECYKTQSGHICIRLTQRFPILHVMADNNDNYYIDDHGDLLTSTKLTSDLIVATGHISAAYAQKTLAPIAQILLDDEFWQNQTVQLNVLGDGSIELVPRVGDHIAYLGSPSNIPKKLERLRKFYQCGLSYAGWNRYSRISVEFDNQIICKKRN